MATSVLRDYTQWDYMFFTRMWGRMTKTITHSLTPESMKHNPAFETFIWLADRTEHMTLEEVKGIIVNFPRNYHLWWMKLYNESPVHVIVESALVIFIFWLLFVRRTIDPKKKDKEKERLTKKEVDWLLKTWEPEPLVPELTDKQKEQNAGYAVVSGYDANGYIAVEGQKVKVLNLSSSDYLGLSAFDSVRDKIQGALTKYGCGSCGPRGFYGTIDVHLEFEGAIAKFMGTEEAIAYSDSASGITSTITAFAKKGDLLLVDDACHEAIRTGVFLSRATVINYKHNDMNDLRTILESICAEDKKKGRDTLQQRRFIVTEGLFRNTGEICLLPELMRLKEKYCYRVMMEDSQAFGTLGKTGRGTAEHYGIPVTDIEIIMIGMDTSLASVGGVCIGTNEVVDHQRLSGPGYCFSASACPFLSAAATQSLSELEKNPQLCASLAENARTLHAGASQIKNLVVKGKASQTCSPIIHLALDSALGFSRDESKSIIMSIARKCMELGSGIASCKFSLTDITNLQPSVRLCATARLTTAEMKKALSDLATATAAAIKVAEKEKKSKK